MTLYERSHAALNDWQEIVEYTLERHGVAQTEKYMAGLIGCIESMAKHEGHFKETEVKGRTIRIKHCRKHYIFGLVRDNGPLMIIALFHERMDLMTRLKNRLK
ncbi:MAG: type II toxin-antitoxin system RelE/ParE family toxin [Desulfobacterales bacterium]|nr:type II toxin-antitoxin system RelE/ParE family toxin [Desulfobacterales bacterium]